MSFFTTTVDRGLKCARTPEGFLICRGVPIARTGLQIYGPDETPIEAGPEGYVKIERSPEEVFRPDTIASAEGKPVVDDHPAEDVDPANFRKLICGHGQNVRRGEGYSDDLLLADLVVMDEGLIRDIEGGKRQVSLGYDAKYRELGPGHGEQYDIIVNHFAIVKDARCGPRCSIQDAMNRAAAVCAARTRDSARLLRPRRRQIHIHFG